MTISMHEMDILISFVLKKPREFIYANPNFKLTKLQVKKLQSLVQRRRRREPMAYLTGHKEFYGLDFLVNRHVLIPRPDTETLVELVLKHCGHLVYQVPTKPIILDVGTGSGNIAIALKQTLPHCRVVATDISAAALKVAQTNARRLQTPIQFYQSNVLQQLPKSLYGKIDIITFNAPYLTKQEAGKKNLKYEPPLALTPAGSPTALMERLLQQAPPFLKPTGRIYFEIGWRQAKQLTKLCQQYFPGSKIQVYQDFGGWDRVVALQNTNFVL